VSPGEHRLFVRPDRRVRVGRVGGEFAGIEHGLIGALDHEWFSDVLGGRPHLGPHALAVGESTAAALSQAPGVRGIDDLQRALGALNAFIIGALRREVTERRTARSTGTDVTAWQASLGPYLTRMLETGRYPTVARLVIDGAHLNAEETFHHNLTTIVDGITSNPHT
jgi:hypothetical protein